jgi:para-aminobenzoate synthetase / 4-amino-4-deoxychorismate lyase
MPGMTATNSLPTVLLESFRSGEFGRSFRFDGLERIIVATTPDEVIPAFREIEIAVASGRHAAGFVSYEAAASLNTDLPAGSAGDLPLLWFGIFLKRIQVTAGSSGGPGGACRVTPPLPSVDEVTYSRTVATIREYIAAGHTYQVNYTIRQKFKVHGDPFGLYRRICRNQQGAFSAWIDTGRFKILSASPELFFSLNNGNLTMRPMKGTAPRSPSPDHDRILAEQLRESTKEQAENIMIVDLVRNDLSVIAQPGSVATPSLFQMESYPTVHQMTSTVTAKLKSGTSLVDLFRALFPCGSVTGAPKKRTMEIIAQTEESPRGIYCGAIGYISPGPEALFSVGIRTAVLDSASDSGELGVGSGITWDSRAGAEYAECLAKGAFLTTEAADFSLIESILWENGSCFLLERHLRRLALSAAYFGFRFDEARGIGKLEQVTRELVNPQKIRILLSADGEATIQCVPLSPPPIGQASALVAFAGQRVCSSDPFLSHKTTRRALYEEQRSRHPECADVIFLNERGEVTEGSYTNVVALLNGVLVTPPLRCGLLPGTFREELLEAGIIREQVLTPDDLGCAEKILLINSVRRWQQVHLAMVSAQPFS